ncbi:MAG: methylated-DNA--[protein]-cysteine S-methyltransferase [Clostridiales bacterium]|nr:methylated-DNA--[protein]-cysteine S-methyltransferase [Clostridiales bacterium]
MVTNQRETVYWTLLDNGAWELYIAATDNGLCYVGSPKAPFGELEEWVRKHIKNYELVEDKNALWPYEAELLEFLEGRRKEFTIPLDLRGTEFQHKVWDELLKVGFGESATYTEIAERIHRPEAARAVGSSIGANPVLIVVPCHRMFGKHGEWRGYRGGLEMKERLLDIEK